MQFYNVKDELTSEYLYWGRFHKTKRWRYSNEFGAYHAIAAVREKARRENWPTDMDHLVVVPDERNE